MRTSLRWTVRVVLLLALLLAVPASAAPYAPTDLGTLGGPSSVATAINGVGAVVGHSTIAPDGTISHATLWFNGRRVDLGTLGGSSSYAEGISNNGYIAGWSFTNDNGGVWHRAFLYDRGRLIDLGALGTGLFSTGYAVNNARQVVGSSAYSSGSYNAHAFVWQNGVMTDLDPTSFRSSAEDINNVGQIVGWTSTPQDQTRTRATLWYQGQVTDLGASFPVNSAALGINELGQVVGYVEDGPRRAVTWINGQMTYLPQWASGGDSTAYEVNNAGHIVGTIVGAAGFTHAVVWIGERIIDLGTLGGRGGTALGINGNGVVVGASMPVRSNNPYEPMHATLWKR